MIPHAFSVFKIKETSFYVKILYIENIYFLYKYFNIESFLKIFKIRSIRDVLDI